MVKSPAPRAERAAGQLVLAALFLEPSPERLEQLRLAARAVADWTEVPLLLESHGFLVLARRNLAQASAEVPAEVQEFLARREEALRQLDLYFRLALERFLVEAAQDHVEVTLLKGASLALDLYPDGALRNPGDLDVLVHPRDVRAAGRAAARAGLFPPEHALPLWWYRLAHFHARFVASSPPRRELELHWALSHPSQLLTVRLEELLARRCPVELRGARAWRLDVLDRFLHLVTHLDRHAEPLALAGDRESLLEAACTPGHPLRLKWILDVRAELERLAVVLDPEVLARRAAAWNAERELHAALAWIRDGLGFEPRAAARVEEVLEALGEDAAASGKQRSGPRPVLDASRPMRGLDFRSAALARIPRWIFPPRRYFERSGRSRAPLIVRQALHAGRALLRGLVGTLALPVAFLGSALLRQIRRLQVGRTARRPEHAPSS